MAEDLDAKLQVLRHPPDDRELLEILLAEDRNVRSDCTEKLGHYRCDAVEMARPHFPLPPIAEAFHADGRGKARRIDVLRRGSHSRSQPACSSTSASFSSCRG